MDVFKRLEQLRKKHGKDRSLIREFPDLSVEQHVAPVSNRFDKTVSWRNTCSCSHASIGCLHKSSYQVLLPGEEKVAWRKV